MSLPSLHAPDFGAAFARAWIENWNRRDVDAVLAHFSENAHFESPLAASIVGNAVISSKVALERYWRAAIARISSLKFTLEGFSWDPSQRTLTVRFLSEIDGRAMQACEVMKFDEGGRQVSGFAYNGYSRSAS